MRIPQQNPTSGQHPRPNRRFGPRADPTHGVVPPSFHKDHLPHRSTRRAQCQQGPRSFPEYIRNGFGPLFVQVSMIHPHPRKGGEIREDLQVELVRDPEHCGVFGDA